MSTVTATTFIDVAQGATRLQVVRYMQVCSMTVITYEWAIVLADEVDYVWYGQWSIPKVLYLLSRYTPFIDTPLNVVNYLMPHIDPIDCSRNYSVSTGASQCFVGYTGSNKGSVTSLYIHWNVHRRIHSHHSYSRHLQDIQEGVLDTRCRSCSPYDGRGSCPLFLRCVDSFWSAAFTADARLFDTIGKQHRLCGLYCITVTGIYHCRADRVSRIRGHACLGPRACC